MGGVAAGAYHNLPYIRALESEAAHGSRAGGSIACAQRMSSLRPQRHRGSGLIMPAVDHPTAEGRIICVGGYGRADECAGLENQRW